MSAVPSKLFSQVAIIATYIILLAMLGYGIYLGKDKVNFSGSPLRLSEEEIVEILFADTVDEMWMLIEKRYKNLELPYDPSGQQNQEWIVRSNSKVKFSIYIGEQNYGQLDIVFWKDKRFEQYMNYIAAKYDSSGEPGVFIIGKEASVKFFPKTVDNNPEIAFFVNNNY